MYIFRPLAIFLECNPTLLVARKFLIYYILLQTILANRHSISLMMILIFFSRKLIKEVMQIMYRNCLHVDINSVL